MIDIKTTSGVVHTMNRVPLEQAYRDEIELWRVNVATVQGFGIDGISITSIPDWRDKMIESYPDEVMDAALQYAAINQFKKEGEL